jgi:hypothetical protein
LPRAATRTLAQRSRLARTSEGSTARVSAWLFDQWISDEQHSSTMLCNSTHVINRLSAAEGESALKRFFINKGDLSSLQNGHHVVDHQCFLKDNQRQPSLKVSAEE